MACFKDFAMLMIWDLIKSIILKQKLKQKQTKNVGNRQPTLLLTPAKYEFFDYIYSLFFCCSFSTLKVSASEGPGGGITQPDSSEVTSYSWVW